MRRCLAWLIRSALVATLLAGPLPAVAATILIDFNDNGSAGFGWNTFHTGNDGTTQALIADDGSASGIDITLPTFNDSAAAGWNPGNPLPSWAPASVANDYSFFNAFFDGGSQTAQFVLSNLDPGMTYTIDMILSRDLDRDQDITITHGGGVAFYDNWNTQADGWVAGNLVTFSGLTPDVANEIVIEMRREGTSAAFNAFRITSVSEPRSLALLGLALLALAGTRRRPR
jgi:hypothetical protein